MMLFLVSFFWGLFAGVLGYSLSDSWQAWAIIIAANVTYSLGCKSSVESSTASELNRIRSEMRR